MVNTEVWTLGRLLDWTAQYLSERGSEFPRLDAEVLLAHAQGCPRIQLYTRFEEPASDSVRTRFKDLVRKRVEGCPVAYLVGTKEFFSLALEVTPAVLIPRPDTEILVLEALRLAKPLPEPKLLDVGTGSGAIAIALTKNHPTLHATAIDLSGPALEVAARNVDRHAVADRVKLLKSDLFAALPAGSQFDFIISNPPYIPSDTLPLLPVGVRDFEPKAALDGGSTGYKVIERLLAGAASFLVPGGWLMLEIGVAQEDPVRERIKKLGTYADPVTINDYAGQPRVLRTQKLSR